MCTLRESFVIREHKKPQKLQTSVTETTMLTVNINIVLK
jgi:hypothetical protein